MSEFEQYLKDWSDDSSYVKLSRLWIQDPIEVEHTLALLEHVDLDLIRWWHVTITLHLYRGRLKRDDQERLIEFVEKVRKLR